MADIDTEIFPFELELNNSKLENEKNLRDFGKNFYNIVKIMIPLMFIFAYVFILLVLPSEPNTGATIIVVTSLMIPTVITLALVRFLYTKETHKESTTPSVSVNLASEIVKVLKDYLSTRTT